MFLQTTDMLKCHISLSYIFTLFCDNAVLRVWLGLGTKTLGYGQKNIAFWLIYLLGLLNTAGDVPTLPKKHQ